MKKSFKDWSLINFISMTIIIGAVYRTYGWTNVSASIPYNYICEVPQSEAAQIDVQQRGEGNFHLTISC